MNNDPSHGGSSPPLPYAIPVAVRQRTFSGELPANLRCGFCGQPIVGQFYRTMGRFACANCAGQVRQVVAGNAFDAGAFVLSALAGLGTAVAGAIAWAAIVHYSHFEIGIVAAFIGVGVGRVVHNVSGKRRGKPLQWLCVLLAACGVALGRLLIDGWSVVDSLRDDDITVTLHNIIMGLRDYPRPLFDPFDLVWIGISAFAAWRLCKPVNLDVAGPYLYQPTSGGLQFDTVEPIETRAPDAASLPPREDARSDNAGQS